MGLSWGFVDIYFISFVVMAGLVPAIPIIEAKRS
jgi:hypothetical protein